MLKQSSPVAAASAAAVTPLTFRMDGWRISINTQCDDQKRDGQASHWEQKRRKREKKLQFTCVKEKKEGRKEEKKAA